MHYYPFNVGDYLSHTAHLTEIEDLAYRRMLDWCYLHESGLPDNVQQVARLVRLRGSEQEIASVLAEFFVLADGSWCQPRIQAEIAAYHTKGAKAAASAAKRWQKGDPGQTSCQPTGPATGPAGDANAMRTQCERNAKQNHEPITNNQQPIKPPAADAACVPFEDFWQLYPKKQAKAPAQKAWNKIKPDQALFNLITNHLATAYQHTELQFVPMPTTYINQQRWLDAILPASQPARLPAPAKPVDDFVARHTNRDWTKGLL